ncbi:ABC transporter substrate-binding protein [Candidatus Hodarchaeum mangrovi]
MKKYLLGIFLGFLLLGAFIPTIENMAAPQITDTLVILHPHSSEFADHVIDAFKVWYTTETGNDITVTTSVKYSGDCYADVVTWNGTNPEADVWWGGGEFYFEEARRANLLEPYEVVEDGNISAYLGGWHLKDDSDTTPTWYAAAMSGFGIIYNTAYLTAEGLDVPTTWASLADPQYFGHVAMTDPDLSGSTVAIVKQLLQFMADEHSGSEITFAANVTSAWELWVKISGNIGTFSTSSSKVPADVSEGNAGIGLCIDYYALDIMVNNTDIGFTYGGATTVSPDPAGIIKGAANLAPAQKFMDFLTGTAGQTLVGDYRTPANFKAGTASHIPKAFTTTGAPNTAAFPIISPFNPAIDGAIHSRAETLFHYWIVENHDDLKAAWEKIISLNDGSQKDDAIAALVKLPADFNGTMAGLVALKYKDSAVTGNWTAHGAAQFAEALEIAGKGGAIPGFELLIILGSLVVLIPLLRKKE